MQKNNLTVIDFFCGAGGFSEGFRQQGFKIVRGIDYWQPAIDTHNLNHGLNDTPKSVLDFWSEDSSDVTEIEKLEDTDCIVGSPPCVSFSSSNKSGKADKTHGIALIEAYLRVIAVKKHKPGSKLKVWYMENVPNSQKFTEERYTFERLNLGKWAKSIGKSPTDFALEVQKKGKVLNSGDYGAPQSRLRFICGEWCETGDFLEPIKTHENNHVTLGDILNKLPKPNNSRTEVFETCYTDPNYHSFQIKGSELTDQFYDTGIYHIEWEQAKYLKMNHPYMGKMSFPENTNRPCRTIMATRSAKTREAIILKSEYSRNGNGEYRLPTVREIASLMGFPLNYQFTGSEGTKWRQIGNAVSPHLSAALAKAIKTKFGLSHSKPDFASLDGLFEKVEIKLNSFKELTFDKPKKRVENARFRRHSIKSGNITVELQNFLNTTDIPGKKWYLVMYFGTGKGFTSIVFSKEKIHKIESYLQKNILDYSTFELEIEGWLEKIGKISLSELQKIYESDLNLLNTKNPIIILNSITEILLNREEKDDLITGINIIPKTQIQIGQLYALVLIGKLLF